LPGRASTPCTAWQDAGDAEAGDAEAAVAVVLPVSLALEPQAAMRTADAVAAMVVIKRMSAPPSVVANY